MLLLRTRRILDDLAIGDRKRALRTEHCYEGQMRPLNAYASCRLYLGLRESAIESYLFPTLRQNRAEGMGHTAGTAMEPTCLRRCGPEFDPWVVFANLDAQRTIRGTMSSSRTTDLFILTSGPHYFFEHSDAAKMIKAISTLSAFIPGVSASSLGLG